MIDIRYARPEDLSALDAIHQHYVREGHITFDEQPRSREASGAWLARYREEGPHRVLVATEADMVLGCASSNPYRDHAAFRETIEVSIYLAPQARGRGVGSALYAKLFELLRGERLHRALAGIALPNDASLALHRRFGFREAGRFDEYAIKNGRRISSVWMEKALDGAW
jgi:phosphinothricin acetyltransferase